MCLYMDYLYAVFICIPDAMQRQQQQLGAAYGTGHFSTTAHSFSLAYLPAKPFEGSSLYSCKVPSLSLARVQK